MIYYIVLHHNILYHTMIYEVPPVLSQPLLQPCCTTRAREACSPGARRPFKKCSSRLRHPSNLGGLWPPRFEASLQRQLHSLKALWALSCRLPSKRKPSDPFKAAYEGLHCKGGLQPRRPEALQEMQLSLEASFKSGRPLAAQI